LQQLAQLTVTAEAGSKCAFKDSRMHLLAEKILAKPKCRHTDDIYILIALWPN
jgi:hypothetical protein